MSHDALMRLDANNTLTASVIPLLGTCFENCSAQHSDNRWMFIVWMLLRPKMTECL